MRNLIRFFIRHYLALLFLLTQGLALLLAIQSNQYNRASFLNITGEISGKVYDAFHSFTEYLSIRTDNEQLAKENLMLRKMLKVNHISGIESYTSINDSLYKQKYTYTIAKVINNSIYRQTNFITINKGLLQGVKPEMAVICPMGIVGIVKDVSPNFSVVLPAININAKISARLSNQGQFGTLSWDGDDPRYANLEEIPFHVKVNVNDTIITSGYSVIFPEGIMIGTVESFDLNEGNNFYNIRVKLFTDFGRLNYVYVVGNLFKEEQENLEKTIEQ